MPARRFYPRKKTTTKKKVHHVPKPPSKMTYKQLLKKTPESFTDLVRLKMLITPLRFTFDTELTGDATNAFAADVQSANQMTDPSKAVGAGQPYLWDVFYQGLYSNAYTKRAKITLDYIDASSSEATAYYVFLVVDSNLINFTTCPVQTVEDLLESRERRIRPAYSLVQAGNRSTAGGRRRLKLEFDINKAYGVSKDAWDSNEAQQTTTAAYASVPVWYGIISVDGSPLPATVKGSFTFRNRYLVKFLDPLDMGPSLSRRVYDERYGEDDSSEDYPRNLKESSAVPVHRAKRSASKGYKKFNTYDRRENQY